MKIVEVGPRDGLQNETAPIPTEVKIAFVNALSLTGVDEIEVVEKLLDIGVNDVSISDTIGRASPDEVKKLPDMLLPKVSPNRIAVHFHDTYGRGCANVLAAWAQEIRIFDASVACGSPGRRHMHPSADWKAGIKTRAGGTHGRDQEPVFEFNGPQCKWRK